MSLFEIDFPQKLLKRIDRYHRHINPIVLNEQGLRLSFKDLILSLVIKGLEHESTRLQLTL